MSTDSPNPATAGPEPTPAPPASETDLRNEAAPQAGAAAAEAPEDEDFDEYEPLTPELVEEEAIRGDFVLRWAVVLLAFLLGSTRIAETPTLVHIRTGEYLAEHGWLPPANDVFSYTALDRPWTNLSWGFDLLAAGVYGLTSFAGLSVFKALLTALAFGLVVHISRPGAPTWWGSICAGLALLAVHLRLTMQPALITLLGTAVVLWILYDWRLTEGRSTKRLWWLVPALLVWSNLDSHAYLGVVLLVLFAIGERLSGRPGDASSSPPRLWPIIGASVAATLVHPFGYKSLLAFRHVYGSEYTAFREYLGGTYLGLALTPSGTALLYVPLTAPEFWANMTLASMASIVLLAAPPVLFLLNRSRLDLSHVLMYAGALGLAIVSAHELAWAALVCSVIATLEGQAWYVANIRQSYSLDTAELVFSRGGRAATVLALAVVGFFGGTGRLRDPGYPRTGYGIDQLLGVSLDDFHNQLSRDESFDHRPFHPLASQGDMLIWVGDQPFVDTRLALYYSPLAADNLLRAHLQTREALVPSRISANDGAPDKPMVWKKTFDDYQVTHVLLRLSAAAPDEYLRLLRFLRDANTWRMTSLGPTAAVLYRLDRHDVPPEEVAAFEKYLDSHTIDYQAAAFKRPLERPGSEIAARIQQIQPPGFYQRYFWSNKREMPAEVHEALHLVRLATLAISTRYEPTALALVAIRKAQVGLASEPDCAAGYIALGQAYQLLANWEAQNALNGQRPIYEGMRYLQAVTSFNQSLVGDPENRMAHQSLALLYRGAGRPELAFEHYETLQRLWADDADPSTDPGMLEPIIERLRSALAEAEAELAKAPPGPEGLSQRIAIALDRGCILEVLKEIEGESVAMNGDFPVQRLRILLLLEAGRVSEASDLAQRFVEPARLAGQTDWAPVTALTSLPDANYKQAIDELRDDADGMLRSGFQRLLLMLPPRTGRLPLPWPLDATQAAQNWNYSLQSTAASRYMEAALLSLEAGQVSPAEEYFREVLRVDPESIDRPLAAYYLTQMTGKNEIDVYPPSERLPGEFASEDEAEPAAAP